MRDSWANAANAEEPDGAGPEHRKQQVTAITVGADLHLELRGPGLRTGLMDALREAVRTGRLTPGTRLPSSRTLAADLGVARNTVADAYAELVAEGWLTARQGSGTRVARRAAPRTRVPSGPPARPSSRTPAHNLRAGTPDLSSFPRGEWLASARRALAVAPHDAFDYGDQRGRVELRTVLADYLARTRGVYADPERVVLCSGFVHGLTLMAEVLAARRGRPGAGSRTRAVGNAGVRVSARAGAKGGAKARAVAVESYGLGFHRDVLTAAGLRTPALTVDEFGTRIDELISGAGELRGVEAVLTTPAHQFPTGAALHPDRRAAVVDWARGAGGLILEDDYDGEFRYDRQPVGALQGLDPERVVYMGTASKSLAPGLRLAWMVLPKALVGEVIEAKGDTAAVPSAVDQLTLAEFITSGAYDRHVRSMRLRYRRRRDQLVEALAEHAPESRVTGIAAGLHAVVELPPGTDERTMIQAAAWQGLAIQGLSAFRHPSVPPGRDALVVGYGAPTDSAWTGALDALCRVLP